MQARSLFRLFSTAAAAVKSSVVKTVTENGVSVSTYQFNPKSKIEISYPEITSFQGLADSMKGQPPINRAILLIAHKDRSFLADDEALRKAYKMVDPADELYTYVKNASWDGTCSYLYDDCNKGKDSMYRYYGPYPDVLAESYNSNSYHGNNGFDLGALCDQLAFTKGERLGRLYGSYDIEQRMPEHLAARKM